MKKGGRILWALALVLGVVALGVVPSLAGDTMGAKAVTLQSPLNLNTATATQLTGLPGVGEKTAQAIIDYRDQNGPFRSVDDLVQVKGIGDKKMEALKGLVAVE